MLLEPRDISLVQLDLATGLQNREIGLNRRQQDLLLGGLVTRLGDVKLDGAKACVFIRLATVIRSGSG